jgi:CMP-N,N'-diacetyllegionaminic acid synthase
MRRSFAIIPARSGSKGIPKKNLQLLYEYNLLEISILAALESGIFESIYVSSDGPAIIKNTQDLAKKSIQKNKIKYIIRPPRISKCHSKTEECIAHFLLKEKDGIKEDDFIYLLQPTSPFRNEDLIANFSSEMLASGCKTGFTANATTPFLWLKGSPLYNIKNRKMRQMYSDDELYWHEDGNIFAFTKKSFLENMNRIDENPFIYKNSQLRSMQIDSMFDLDYCRYICEKDIGVNNWLLKLANLLQK